MRLVLLAALCGIAFAVPETTYHQHKVLRFTPNEKQLQLLKQFEDAPGFDFWNDVHKIGDNLDIMVAPEQQTDFLKLLEDENISYNVIHNNVQELIDAEKRYARNVTANPSNRAISFTQYNRFSAINSYLQELASNYPNLVTLQTIGQSYEGRDLVMIKISSGGSGNPAVLVDAGIHAREWIAPAMALYIIQQLVENNSANSALTSGLDWYIIPVLNPDGYEYTHTTTRLWRKTRSPTSSASCRGVDGNRNFAFHWMETGASSSPCAETFAGSSAFSEPETQAIRDFALANSNIKLYLTFHSYGNYLLYPWGYTSSLPSDWRTLQSLAEEANSAHVSAGGSSYSIGSSTNVLYAAAGGSDDYMKGVAGIALSYTVELTNTIYGFQFPASQIQSTVLRFFSAVRVYGNYVKNNF